MTDHPLTDARVVELWNASRPATSWENAWALRPLGDRDRTHPLLAPLRTAYDAGREHEREHADPHHDPRPWQDCTVKDIRKGDLVETQDGGIARTGIAHHQDEVGDWHAEDGYFLTNGDNWPIRRIPAPTPPVEEVELPTEDGAVIFPADGHKFIRGTIDGAFDRLTFNADSWCWIGWDRSAKEAVALEPRYITPGTWTAETLKETRND